MSTRLKFRPNTKTRLLRGTTTTIRTVDHTHDPLCTLHRSRCPMPASDLAPTAWGLRCSLSRGGRA